MPTGIEPRTADCKSAALTTIPGLYIYIITKITELPSAGEKYRELCWHGIANNKITAADLWLEYISLTKS